MDRGNINSAEVVTYDDYDAVPVLSMEYVNGTIGMVRQLMTMNTADYSLVNLGIFGQVMEDPWGGTPYDFYNGLIIKN